MILEFKLWRKTICYKRYVMVSWMKVKPTVERILLIEKVEHSINKYLFDKNFNMVLFIEKKYVYIYKYENR